MTETDPSGFLIGPMSGGSRQFAITPNDSDDLTHPPRALLVNDTGPVNVAFIAFNDTVAMTWKGLTAGTVIPMYVKRVLATGTTALDLIGLY